MSYTSWSVVFGEQPSAAKWNILGANDASFNDGTGIAGLYKNLLTVDSNPYKFSAYKSASTQSITTAGNTKITFDAEDFDTNGNFASSTYTIPVDGFYLFTCSLGYNSAASGTRLLPLLYKNGAEYRRFDDRFTNAIAGQGGIAFMDQTTAGDTIEIYGVPVGATTVIINSQKNTWFQGILLCRT